MMPPASHSRPWCEAWDRASAGLVAELTCPRPHPLRIRELIDRRQRLMTAEPRPSPDWSPAARKQWLEVATEREQEIQELFRRYRSVVERAMEGFRAGSRTRRVYQGEVLPRSGWSVDDIA